MARHDEHPHRACLARLADALQHLATARALLAEPLSVIAAEQHLDNWQEHLDALEDGTRGAERDVGVVLDRVIARAERLNAAPFQTGIAQGYAP